MKGRRGKEFLQHRSALRHLSVGRCSPADLGKGKKEGERKKGETATLCISLGERVSFRQSCAEEGERGKKNSLSVTLPFFPGVYLWSRFTEEKGFLSASLAEVSADDFEDPGHILSGTEEKERGGRHWRPYMLDALFPLCRISRCREFFGPNTSRRN